jgi:hypothetical protein
MLSQYTPTATLPTADMSKARNFYEGTLGLTPSVMRRVGCSSRAAMLDCSSTSLSTPAPIRPQPPASRCLSRCFRARSTRFGLRDRVRNDRRTGLGLGQWRRVDEFVDASRLVQRPRRQPHQRRLVRRQLGLGSRGNGDICVRGRAETAGPAHVGLLQQTRFVSHRQSDPKNRR